MSIMKRVISGVKNYNLRSVRMSLEKATERYKNGNLDRVKKEEERVKSVKNSRKV